MMVIEKNIALRQDCAATSRIWEWFCCLQRRWCPMVDRIIVRSRAIPHSSCNRDQWGWKPTAAAELSSAIMHLLAHRGVKEIIWRLSCNVQRWELSFRCERDTEMIKEGLCYPHQKGQEGPVCFQTHRSRTRDRTVRVNAWFWLLIWLHRSSRMQRQSFFRPLSMQYDNGHESTDGSRPSRWNLVRAVLSALTGSSWNPLLKCGRHSRESWTLWRDTIDNKASVQSNIALMNALSVDYDIAWLVWTHSRNGTCKEVTLWFQETINDKFRGHLDFSEELNRVLVLDESMSPLVEISLRVLQRAVLFNFAQWWNGWSQYNDPLTRLLLARWRLS